LLLVGKGDSVTAEQVIGRAELLGEAVVVRVAEELGCTPSEVPHQVAVKNGDAVKRGDILATQRVLWGLFKTEVRAPVGGVIERISDITGSLMIRLPSQQITVAGYLPGTVVSIEEGIAVSLSATCAFVQGVFGVGAESHGKVTMLPSFASDTVSVDILPSSCSGLLLVSRDAPSLHLLYEAGRRGCRGWIAGSIEDVILESFAQKRFGVAVTGDEQVPFPLVITEGFGAIPMSDRAMDLFIANQGAIACISGITQVRAGAVRPEILIPLPETLQVHTEATSDQEHGLRVGSTVRCIRHPVFGRQGVITALPADPQVIGTGAHARVAEVTLRSDPVSGEEVSILIPRANLEVLEA
jgi:hypothetical protein